MYAPALKETPSVADPASHRSDQADALAQALVAVFGRCGVRVSCMPASVEMLPERTWENGATLQLFSGVDDVQNFAVFAGNTAAGEMVRGLFGDGAGEVATDASIRDGLAETLNQVVGRIKHAETTAAGAQPSLGTPDFLDPADAEMYAHTQPAAIFCGVTCDAWDAEVMFMTSPKRQRAISALERATALLIRSGLEPAATVRACRLLEVVRGPLLALCELPAMGITLSWCVENLAVLVNGDVGYGAREMFYRVLRELEALLAALVQLTAPAETTALVIPTDEHQRSLLRDFSGETLRGIERCRHLFSSSLEATPHSPFGLMHTVQVTAGFLHLEQVEDLARSTGRLIGSVRECGARMTRHQMQGVRHSVSLIEGWVEALVEGLDRDQPVAWSPEIEAHNRMIEHVLECGGQIVVHAPEGVHVESVPSGQLQLDEPQLARLESLRTEVQEWAELSRSEGPVRSLAEPGEFFDRAHRELVSICQSVRRAPMGPVLERLARHCHEASARYGKLVRVDAAGHEIDAPEHLMNALAAPLVHLVNNAIEHGIEDGTERGQEGKPVLALVQLRAERIEGSLILEVIDDGRGMPLEVLRQHGDAFIPGGELEGGGQEDVHRLRMRSGGSALQPRSGIDVVVSEVEAAGGRVEVQGARGKGTRVRLVLPEPDGLAAELDDDDFAELHAAGELVFL